MNIEPKSTKTSEKMLKKMQKPNFSAKNSKKFTPIMHFKIQNFGKVLKISEHIVEKFQLLMEIYITAVGPLNVYKKSFP